MADIYIKTVKRKHKKSFESSVSDGGENKLVKGLKMGFLALVIALVVYFLTQKLLVPNIAIWARELISLILSLLVLGAFSASIEGKSNMGCSVVFFIIAIFIQQMVSGYANYDFSNESDSQERPRREEVRILNLTPRAEPYYFNLQNIGDETRPFKVSYNSRFRINFSSETYGFEIIFPNEGRVVKAQKGRVSSRTNNPVYILRAVEPNQNIRVQITVY